MAQKTLETLQTLAAVDARFTELGGELTEEQKSAADSYAQQLMDNYGDAYTANGIGLETLKLFQQLRTSRSCCWILSTVKTARPLWRTAS